jgi:hypothetical protein
MDDVSIYGPHTGTRPVSRGFFLLSVPVRFVSSAYGRNNVSAENTALMQEFINCGNIWMDDMSTQDITPECPCLSRVLPPSHSGALYFPEISKKRRLLRKNSQRFFQKVGSAGIEPAAFAL